MTKQRRSSKRLQDKKYGNVRGDNGYKLCRFCRKEVFPPRKTICSDECVHQWKLRSDNKYLRKFVYARDLGICASCKSDTRFQKIEIENATRNATLNGIILTTNIELNDLLLRYKLTLKESQKTLWHADHIIEVCNGGGESGLDNIQTLCVKCHKLKNKKLSDEKKRK